MGITLNQVLGHQNLRPLQADIIDCAIRGCSCLAILPTGYGKSLCYQVAALELGKTSIVVSPLIALMQDQVNALQAKNIHAARFDSTLTDEARQNLLEELQSGAIRLLYIAPESLENTALTNILNQIPLGIFVIDEAHCVSQWGHSFRPNYLSLPQIAQSYPFHAVMALTATAPPRVCDDLASIFHIPTEGIFSLSPQRENITRQLRPCTAQERSQELTQFLKISAHRPSLLYCRTRQSTEELATILAQQGYKTSSYHAGLPSELRAEIQENYLAEKLDILVATTAFGMGIDKPNIRSVIHYHAPDCFEAYLQESGRAGRDSAPAQSLVFLCPEDLQAAETRIFASTPDIDGITSALKYFFRSSSPLISLWELSDACDLPETTITRILFDLTLRGEVKILQRFPKYYRVKPLFTLQVICQGREEEEICILSWLYENRDRSLDELADVLRLDLTQTHEWLLDLTLSGEWHVALRQKALLLELQKTNISLETIAAELHSHYQKQSQENLDRLLIFWGNIHQNTCFNQAIGDYFGFPLEQACGTCTPCLGTLSPRPPLPPHEAVKSEIISQIQNYASSQPKALTRPIQWIRFLLGISSPSSLRHRLWQHSLYGCLSHVSWQDISLIMNSMKLGHRF